MWPKNCFVPGDWRNGLHMSTLKTFPCWVMVLVAAGILGGCSQTAKSPNVSEDIRKALDQAGLKAVSIDQDREKGVVTLTGHVAGDNEKGQAESIARAIR